jgi:hypothetical protein
MKKHDCKEKRIRTCLLAGNTLSKLEALNFFKHNNLADVVHKMNKEKPGLIGKIWKHGKDKSRFACYMLASLVKRHKPA